MAIDNLARLWYLNFNYYRNRKTSIRCGLNMFHIQSQIFDNMLSKKHVLINFVALLFGRSF